MASGAGGATSKIVPWNSQVGGWTDQTESAEGEMKGSLEHLLYLLSDEGVARKLHHFRWSSQGGEVHYD